MNNSLKFIFLIFNLVPSLTSSVNNFSQPLSETELQVGQNVSEVVKRDSKLILHGGMKVDGLTYSLPKTCQRACTLSFPVSNKNNGLKRFLTSFICATQSVLSDPDDEQVIQFGHVEGGSDRPEHGLEYSLVEIYPNFWSDDSYRIPFSAIDSVAGNNNGLVDTPLPILPVLNRPLSEKDKVYAYGGDSGMVKGTIKKIGVEIQGSVP